ncbi:serine protease [bacterium]|nr:serine protease [bacterium]
MTSSVVSVTSGRGNGSGFLYKEGGYVLTCKTFLGSSKEVKVITAEEKEYKGKVLAKSLVSNLAVIKIDLRDHAIIELGTEADISIDSTVSVVGFPESGASSELAIRSGSIINKSKKIITQSYMQINALLDEQDSGAPLCAPIGKAIGMVTVPPSNYSGSEQLKIVTKVSDIRKFLKKYERRIAP